VPKARQELYETGLWNFDSKNSTIGDAKGSTFLIEIKDFY